MVDSLIFGSVQVLQKCADIQEHISEGANSFLLTEYNYMAIFMVRSPRSGVQMHA